ncbi:MAG: long-chain-acyl-CoA synthetase [Proteobacteria bacterium]|nr:long-chain-acyl-CoA synthetase [Pseudomonadota bacterium]
MQDFQVPSREETLARLMRGARRVTGFTRDMPYTVADRLEERARDSGARPFILFEDQCVTYAEANCWANQVANAALAAGLRCGDVVALLMHNRPQFVLIWLGLAKAGIVTALINTSATGDVLGHALRQVAPRALIVGSELVASLDGLDPADRPAVIWEQAETAPEGSSGGVSSVEGRSGGGSSGGGRSRSSLRSEGGAYGSDFDAALRAASDRDPDRAVRAGVRLADPLYYIFTSGTTGLPKAARVSHMRFINAGEMMGGLLGFGADDVFYCVLPLYHGAGGMVVPSVALAFGVPFVLRRKFSTRGFWQDVRRHRITAVYYIGEIIRYLLEAPVRPDDRDHSLRAMGGAGLRPDVWRQFVVRFGVTDVVEGLGSTEANYGISNVDNRIGSVGRLPYPQHSNIRVVRYDVDQDTHVRDAQGHLVLARPGEPGELIAEVLGGSGVMGFFEGYTSPQATEAKLLRDVFQPGDVWFRSGDLVRFDADDYFYFVDRVGDTFRWKGENVSTQEVEVTLAPFAGPTVINVYGVRVPGTEGRAGMAALTYAPGGLFDPAAFYAFASAHLAPHAVPLFVRLSATADMTTTFKLRKVDLQRQGYDPALANGDALFVADGAAGRYVPLTEAALARLDIAAYAADSGAAGVR